MLKRPALIYLDSSDFANLRAKSGEYADLRHELVDLRSQGKVALGYSFLHIYEIIQDGSDEYELDRMEKAKSIIDLCGPNCFPFFPDYESGRRYPNDGYWLPMEAVDSISGESLTNMMKEKIYEHRDFNRSQRRKLASNIKAFTAEALDERTMSEAFGRLPLSPEFFEKNYFRRYLEGEITEKKFNSLIRHWMCDPIYYFRFWYKYSGKSNVLKDVVEKYYGNLQESLRKIAQLRSEMKIQADAARQSLQEYKKAYYQLNPELRKVVAHPSTFKPTETSIADFNFDSIQIGFNFLNHYFNHKLANNVEIPKSDFGDLMHFFYSNHCDIFRMDKAFYNVMNDVWPIRKAYLLNDLRKLPEAIKQFHA